MTMFAFARWGVVVLLALLVPPAGSKAALADRPMAMTGSTLLGPYLTAIVERLVARGAIGKPDMRFGGTGAGVRRFCTVKGEGEADVVAMSRGMRVGEFEMCVENGVDKIIEINLGMNALVLVARKDDADFDLKLLDLYHAVAHELPRDGEFLINRFKRWAEIDRALPDLPIKVLVPAVGLGARGFFEDRFLEAACREVPDIKTIFAARERVRQCVTLRRDEGVIEEIKVPYDQNLRRMMAAAAKGTIAVTALNFAQAIPDVVKVLPLDGVAPDQPNIADRSYRFVRPLHVYVKRDKVKDWRGRGPVAGLREFITEATRDEAIGPEGYLVRDGLVPLRFDQREAVRRDALSLTVMSK